MNLPSECLAALAGRVRLPLEFDAHGQCFLLLDGTLMISLRRVEKAVILYGMLGECPEYASAAFCKRVLAATLDVSEAGGGIGYDEETGALMLIERVPMARLGADANAFVDAFDAFATRLEHLLVAFGDAGASETQWRAQATDERLRAEIIP
ncbi:chaperone SicP (plasmid) [Burkholderia sp. FERM BP-3421]|jgi:hypothetical protein|uniref:chaperone SicP n=1 Tax=Burkholderia sp. FERM BP-3421 TaxID=1494466 RepID=UPI002361BE3A|nr:chaperone SicP [Burkholderia sp. FERM BP-3421]WDD90777.1 chaperone SicP [Burkholderia sp. FERM BP-3421]